ncbi:hypothetical protein EX30DRAFT_217132 [Ascodesmis nigricans]|uniref:Nudix hydrolase domain-containing protein n=1 Tax=Ascodesmis nigricans TaxID=341454 RepID=A0A4S2MZH0_9PEZI|nr:hypothetical protein EX30DRAFT_217132 [Ascodesmis nigricans]
MAPLSAKSSEALARLREYQPPTPSIYNSLPLTRRAAVLILLFADRRGDLRVVLTLRSAFLRTFAGQVALPGGRADYLEESPFETARREAYEEIGLPLDHQGTLPSTFTVEHICELPCSLAKTVVAVRPCVAFLRDNTPKQNADVEDTLIPRLQKDEVESLFTVLLERFLSKTYPLKLPGSDAVEEREWNSGKWLTSYQKPWRMQEFMAPVWEKTTLREYRVWGMTAKIMLDVTRIAYGRNPEFEFNEEIGDEELIRYLHSEGQMREKQRKPVSTI